jgi:hypothetical protein
MGMTRLAICVFVLAVLLGPIYTAAGYSPISHVISELAAQNTPNSHLMAGAFVLLGVGLLLDACRAFRSAMLPFMAFGLFFGAAGLFGHKPITQGVPYSEWMDAVHSSLATASGISLTLGFIWQSLQARSVAYRWQALLLASACVALPLWMLWQPSIQGLVQRAMYALVFLWLWAYYPRQTDA